MPAAHNFHEDREWCEREPKQPPSKSINNRPGAETKQCSLPIRVPFLHSRYPVLLKTDPLLFLEMEFTFKK